MSEDDCADGALVDDPLGDQRDEQVGRVRHRVEDHDEEDERRDWMVVDEGDAGAVLVFVSRWTAACGKVWPANDR